MDGGNYSHVRGSSSRGGWYHNANYRLFLPINQAESITIAFQEPGIAVQFDMQWLFGSAQKWNSW